MSINPDNNIAPEVSGVNSSEVTPAPASADRFAILARKEKAMRDRIRSIEEQERSFKQREQEYQNSFISKEKLQKDPLAALAELGLTYDKITEQALNQPSEQDSHFRAMREEITHLRNLIEGSQKQQEEQKNSQYQNALKQIQFDVDNLISSDPEFELIKEMGASQQVVDYIDQMQKEHGRQVSIKDAAKLVEDYLFENALKYAKVGKISKALQPKEEQKSIQKPAPTLTSNNTVSPTKPQTDKDRVARAIAAFQNKQA